MPTTWKIAAAPGLKSYSSFGGLFDAGTHWYDWLKTAVAGGIIEHRIGYGKAAYFIPGGEGVAAFSVLPLPGPNNVSLRWHSAVANAPASCGAAHV